MKAGSILLSFLLAPAFLFATSPPPVPESFLNFLARALKEGKLDIFKDSLTQCPIDFSDANSEETNGLLRATATHGDGECVKMLMSQAGIDVRMCSWLGAMNAAEAGNLDALIGFKDGSLENALSVMLQPPQKTSLPMTMELLDRHPEMFRQAMIFAAPNVNLLGFGMVMGNTEKSAYHFDILAALVRLGQESGLMQSATVEEFTICAGKAYEYALGTGNGDLKKLAIALLMDASVSLTQRIDILSSQKDCHNAASFLIMQLIAAENPNFSVPSEVLDKIISNNVHI